MKEKLLLVSVAVVYRRRNDTVEWFLVKPGEESDWEFPRTVVRKGESSVRAAIRMMAEQAGMKAKVLEEVGRSGGAVRLKGKMVSQRFIYYLMALRNSGEILEFVETEWLDYSRAAKRIKSKRDSGILRQARDMLRELDRQRAKRRKEREKMEAELGGVA